MKNELKNILKGNGNISDLTSLINEYVTIEKEKEPKSEELTALTQLVSSNGFMLHSMIDNILSNPNKYNLEITILKDRNKEPIEYFIEEIQ